MDGDEDDGYDEVIYPVDFRTNGHIVDDLMHDILVKPLQPGVRLTAIFDSCHSGSALDLPYIYSTSGVLKEPNLAKEAGQGLLGIVSSYARGDLGGMASTAMGFFKKATTGDDVYQRNLRTKTSPADVIMWSGSKDTQTSSDAQIGGEATGAMSWAFITALKKNPQQSYVQLLNSIREELQGRYSQKPQLSSSHPLSESIRLSSGLRQQTNEGDRYQFVVCDVRISEPRDQGTAMGSWAWKSAWQARLVIGTGVAYDWECHGGLTTFLLARTNDGFQHGNGVARMAESCSAEFNQVSPFSLPPKH